MKSFFTILICVFTLPCFSQKVVVRGFASDITNGEFPVSVVLNDTIHKFSIKYLKTEEFDKEKYAEFMALFKNKSFCVYTSNNKYFIIEAKITDTLYFVSPKSITQKYLVADLLKLSKIDIKLKSEPCKEYVPCKDASPGNYYVFIGKKISVKGVNYFNNYCNTFLTDGKYEAIYKIIKNVNGVYKQDTIRFIAYDHNHTTPFAQSKYVLLFVGEYCGELIHTKYQYFDVYPTKNGRWASPGNPYRFDENEKSKPIKAVPVVFDNDLSFDTKSLFFRNYYTDTSPYFTIDGAKATPILGTYVEDLVKLKQETDLKYDHIVLK